MNPTFNIPRFCKLFLTEFRLHKKGYLGIILAAFVLTIYKQCLLYRHNIRFSSEIPDWEDMFFSPFNFDNSFMFSWFVPLVLYGFLYHSTKGFTHAMLPASSLEKFSSAWIHCVIVGPILILATYCFSALLGDIAGFNVGWKLNPYMSYVGYVSYYGHVGLLQGICFLGVFWFKRMKIFKTLGAFILLYCSIMLSWVLRTNVFADTHIFDGRVFYGYESVYLSIMVLLTISLWVLAYFKFRRTQI